jgi:hypothetical protein
MPHLPVIADTFRVAFIWADSSLGNAANVIHITSVGNTAADVNTQVHSAIDSRMWTCQRSGSKITGLSITPLDGTTATVFFPSPGTSSWEGQGSGEVAPALSALVKLTTAVRGRSFRGRVFTPWVTESVNNDGRLTSTALTNLTAGWEAFRINLASNPGISLEVASYRLGQATPVTATSGEAVCATQRRRQTRLR